jgi:GH43 family beta-xylosidase
MRRIALGLLVAALAGTAAAADKTYQVTGPVVEVKPDSIVVQKGKENWEIGTSADTKGASGLKKGDKVTVMYRMTATSIEVKPGAKAKK